MLPPLGNIGSLGTIVFGFSSTVPFFRTPSCVSTEQPLVNAVIDEVLPHALHTEAREKDAVYATVARVAVPLDLHEADVRTFMEHARDRHGVDLAVARELHVKADGVLSRPQMISVLDGAGSRLPCDALGHLTDGGPKGRAKSSCLRVSMSVDACFCGEAHCSSSLLTMSGWGG